MKQINSFYKQYKLTRSTSFNYFTVLWYCSTHHHHHQ